MAVYKTAEAGSYVALSEEVVVEKLIIPNGYRWTWKCASCGTHMEETCPRKCYMDDPQMVNVHLTVLTNLLSTKDGDILQGYLSVRALCTLFGLSEEEFIGRELFHKQNLEELIHSFKAQNIHVLIHTKRTPDRGTLHNFEEVYTIDQIPVESKRTRRK